MILSKASSLFEKLCAELPNQKGTTRLSQIQALKSVVQFVTLNDQVMEAEVSEQVFSQMLTLLRPGEEADLVRNQAI